MSSAFININLVVVYQDFGVLPFMQVLQTVTAHNDGELVTGIFLSEISHGVDSIRWSREIEFNVAGFEFAFSFKCQLHEVQAVIFIEQSRRRLEWVLWRYH